MTGIVLTLFHEVAGHVLIGHLTGGREATPPAMDPHHDPERPLKRGESGRWIEYLWTRGITGLMLANNNDPYKIPCPKIYKRVKMSSIGGSSSKAMPSFGSMLEPPKTQLSDVKVWCNAITMEAMVAILKEGGSC